MSAPLARFLVFISSASVLVLEVLAGRLMAPYVGVSLETFTGIIGTVLAAIALGSWVGGRVADRRDPAPLLVTAFLVGGVLALLAPTVIAVVGPAFQGGGSVAIVMVAALGFFAPAAVLSAVTPLVVKLRLASLDQTGEVVGSLSAVGTAGALVGTFVTGFVALAALATRPIVLIVGAMLVAIGVALAWRGRRLDRGVASSVLAAMLVGFALMAYRGPCTWETAYSCANVRVDPEGSSGRLLELNRLSHSWFDLDDPTSLRFRYIRDFAAVIDAEVAPGPVRALALGGGGFTMPRYLQATRPGSEVTVFEIDDTLVDIVESEMGLDRSSFTIVTDDARTALARTTADPAAEGTADPAAEGTADPAAEGTAGEAAEGTAAEGGAGGERFGLVIGDAFASPSVPWHLTTVEFLTELASTMTPDGLYLMNVIDYRNRNLVRAEIATLQQVFDQVLVVAPPGHSVGSGGGNFVLVASDVPLDAAAIGAALRRFDSESVVMAGDEVDAFVDGARILTDDYAPADQLIEYPHWN